MARRAGALPGLTLRFALAGRGTVSFALAFQALLLGTVGAHHILGLEASDEGVYPLAVFHSHVAHACASQCREMCSATQRHPYVAC